MIVLPIFLRRHNLIREERDDNPFSQTLWHYDNADRLLSHEGAQPGNQHLRWDGASIKEAPKTP
ncbi:hypothetical protein NB725_000638 [Pantoea ananatis]|nr:hypothetical protein [Pantoea ananatis]MCW0338557.1 hypothetical protein [Pantoea ananatis]MCW0355830.1 hypothetical protein [Pantoea ananatis]MCW0361028.1 hypothetical protein [Pantoea ananatis]